VKVSILFLSVLSFFTLIIVLFIIHVLVYFTYTKYTDFYIYKYTILDYPKFYKDLKYQNSYLLIGMK